MHFATNKIAPVNMLSIHRSVCDIISQTALKIPQATNLLLAIWNYLQHWDVNISNFNLFTNKL